MRTIIQAGIAYEILIDEQDEHYLDKGPWEICASRNTHYVRGCKKNPVGRRFLHRVIMGSPYGMEVDHHDGNGLNVRRVNLRPATRQQNSANRIKGNFSNATSRFKGVYERAPGRFVAQITIKNRNRHLGSFPSEEAAARRYDHAAVEAFGEFAKLNFPPNAGPLTKWA